MGRLTEFFRAGFNEKQVDALKNITAYPYISPAGDGKVFYVDPGRTALSKSSGSGTTPENAFNTLAEAIDAAVTLRGDVILCLPGTEAVLVADAPVVVDKAKLTIASVPHLSGMRNGEDRYKISLTSGVGSDATNVINCTVPCQIIGIDIQNAHAAPTVAALNLAAAATGSLVENCSFQAKTATTGIGISINGNGGGASIIRNCFFLLLAKGITFEHATASIGDIIENNLFSLCTAGVYWTTNSRLTIIKGNTFTPCSSANYALNFNGQAGESGYIISVVDNTFVGESLATCIYYSATVNTYALYAGVYINFVGNQYRKSNSDVSDGWNYTKSLEADFGTNPSENLFDVTGLVECRVFGLVSTALTTGGATTLVVGTASNTTAFANVVDTVTGSTIGDVIAGTSATTTAASVSADTVICAADTILATGHADYTAGKAYFYCIWRPLVAGSAVVASA